MEILIEIPLWFVVLWLVSGAMAMLRALYEQWYDGEDIMGDGILSLVVFTLLGLITVAVVIAAALDDIMDETTIKKGRKKEEDK